LSAGPRYIDVLINDVEKDRKWRGTFVYGEHKSSERHHMWTVLRRIKTDVDAPWMMIGDFNETKWQHEHLSDTKRSKKRMADFRRCLNFCDLHDIPFVGPPWTFDNKQKDNKNVKLGLIGRLPLIAGPLYTLMPSSLILFHQDLITYLFS
jgi:hypothetical protein